MHRRCSRARAHLLSLRLIIPHHPSGMRVTLDRLEGRGGGELPASCPCEAVRAEAGQTGAGPQGVQGGAERLVWWAWM